MADRGAYEERSRVPAGSRILTLSGSELRRLLREGRPVPE